MSTPGPDQARSRSVRRGAFPVRRADLEQAEPFVPSPAGEDEVAEDLVPDGAVGADITRAPRESGDQDQQTTDRDPSTGASPAPG